MDGSTACIILPWASKFLLQINEQQAVETAHVFQQARLVEQELETKSREAADLLSESHATKARAGWAAVRHVGGELSTLPNSSHKFGPSGTCSEN